MEKKNQGFFRYSASGGSFQEGTEELKLQFIILLGKKINARKSM